MLVRVWMAGGARHTTSISMSRLDADVAEVEKAAIVVTISGEPLLNRFPPQTMKPALIARDCVQIGQKRIDAASKSCEGVYSHGVIAQGVLSNVVC